MVSVCPIRSYNPNLTFSAKKNKKDNVDNNKHVSNQQVSKNNNLGISKTTAGLLASTAFLLGYQTGGTLPKLYNSNDEIKEIQVNNDSINATVKDIRLSDINDSIITWEEASKLTKNLRPKDNEVKANWFTRDTININGRDVIRERRYEIKEAAFLKDNRIKDINNDTLVDRSEYSDYKLIPQKHTIYVNADDQLLQIQLYKGINAQTLMPESGTIEGRLTNGKWGKANVKFSKELIFENDKPVKKTTKPKAKPKKQTQSQPAQTSSKKKSQEKDLYTRWVEAVLGL